MTISITDQNTNDTTPYTLPDEGDRSGSSGFRKPSAGASRITRARAPEPPDRHSQRGNTHVTQSEGTAHRPARAPAAVLAAALIAIAPGGASPARGIGQHRHGKCRRPGQARDRARARRLGGRLELEQRHQPAPAQRLHRVRAAQPAARPAAGLRLPAPVPDPERSPPGEAGRPGRALLRRGGHHQRRGRRARGQGPGVRGCLHSRSGRYHRPPGRRDIRILPGQPRRRLRPRALPGRAGR